MAKKQLKNFIFEPGIGKDDGLYPNAAALILANKSFLQQQVVAFINYNIANNIAPYVGYTYASQKCIRDVGYFIDAVVHDIRYGGNVKSRQVADYFWIDGEPQIRGDVSPETTGQAYLRNIINQYILTKIAVSPSYGNTTPQIFPAGISTESDGPTANTALWNIFSTVITNGPSAIPAKVPGVSSIRLAGQIDASSILLITDVDTGNILYSFADPLNTVRVTYKQGRSSGDGNLLSDLDFPTWWQVSDSITTIDLSADTSTLTASANIQFFVEEASQQIRPWEFGTDAIERMRVASPQAMLDADFEYGLQPTKWQALGLLRMYPSTYEIPGSDLTVLSCVTDASVNTGFFGSSLITVTTSGVHGFPVGQPISVKGLNNTVNGFARAEGSFLVYSTPSSVSFSYYASAKVGTTNEESLLTSFIQIRQAQFFTGASIGQPSFSVFTNGTALAIVTALAATAGATSFVYTGSAPTVGSPVTGPSTIPVGTSVSGTVGAASVTTNVLLNTLTTDTQISLTNLSGIQTGMALDVGGTASTINTIAGSQLSLSNQLNVAYKGRNHTNTAVSGTLVAPAGEYARFDVSRSAGTYTLTLSAAASPNAINYQKGDRLKILGTNLGGASPANDVNILVTATGTGNDIDTFTYSGTSVLGGATYNNVNQTSTTGTPGGTGFQLNVTRTGGTGTYSISSSVAGLNYSASEQLTFSGANFGGASPANNIVIIVNSTTSDGGVLTYTVSGSPVGASGNATYSSVSADNVAHLGSGAEFNITRSSGVYTAAINNGGTGYEEGNQITVLGTNLNGAIANNATVIITGVAAGVINAVTVSGTGYGGDSITVYPTMSISEPITGNIPLGTALNVGAIATFQVDFQAPHGLVPGTTILSQVTSQPAPELASTARTLTGSGTWAVVGFGGIFSAVRSGATATQRSTNGQLWAAGGVMPSAANWSSVAAGKIGATTYFVAVSNGSTAAAWSVNSGTSWSSATLPSGANWSAVTYGDGKFVAVSTGSTAAAYSIDGGANWVSATLPASANWTGVSAGLVGTSIYFIAVASGGTNAAYSPDGGATWLATGALPASANWSGIAYGNNRFVAISTGSANAAFSINGTTWTLSTLPSSSTWNNIIYGDDVFLIAAKSTTDALTSFTGETGSFTPRILSTSSTWESLAFSYYTGQGFGRFVLTNEATTALEINLTSANHQLGTGPHVISAVPSAASIRFVARTTGIVNTTDSSVTGIVYARPDSFFVHRPFDGGVQLGTGNPSHGAQAIRQSKKYIRYQSGKGIMYTTGGLFAPSYNLSGATSNGTAINSLITFVTDDTDHGVQAGAVVETNGFVSFEYNGEFTVESVIDARRFTARSAVVLSVTTAQLGTDCKMILKRWHGSCVRIGAFDEQNGIFYQYDGYEMAVVRRSSTNQLTGVVACNVDSNSVAGTGTRFQDQLKVGDKIVIRGMSHLVTQINSQTQMFVTPDWRGANNITGARVCITEELYIPSSQWNLDKLDGTGPSGYDILPWRMQMLGMQYSWYAAGFIEWMLRGADGKFVFLHKIRNSNTNTEAYMRTANLPVRYEVENRTAISKLYTAINESVTTVELFDATRFPTNGVIYVDNELISYNGKSGRTLTGCTRAATFSSFTAGINRVYSAGFATSHLVNAGVTLISCTATPTISHWGSALLTDGMFDEDRGYIFNYAATGLSVSTAKQTAFMIRLAPSVSNALVGDLGERDLLNRAQLLLNEVAITTDTGSGTVVIEGVLNPRNYPANPSNITWTGLASSAAGGQPSFAQIALGGSINWGGIPGTTTTATIQGALTTTINAVGFTTVTQNLTAIANSGFRTRAFQTTNNDFFITNAAYDAITATPLRVGDRIVVGTFVTAGQSISTITRAYLGSGYTRIVMSSNANATSAVSTNVTTPVQNSISINYASSVVNGRQDFLITDAENTAQNLALGDTLSAASYIVVSQTIANLTPSYARVNGVNYTRIVMNTSANATIAVNTNLAVTVTASGTGANYTGNFLFFTQASWNNSGAANGTRVATSYTQFPANTSVSAVTTRRLGTVTTIRATFTQTLTTSVSASTSITLQFGDPQFALPGEQVFAFLCQPGSLNTLSLAELKELTTTAIGGRGTFPNGPDVLAINVYKISGGAVNGSIVLRWGEAQA